MRDSKSSKPGERNGRGKRVLLINPSKEDKFVVDRIHMGLSLLGGILSDHGHEVKLLDFAFLRDFKDRLTIPSIERVIDDFQPDLIGMTVFTYLYDECLTLIERISRHCDLPIVLGGPHFSIFHEDFTQDQRISYVVRGEAEKVVVNLVESAKRENRPVILDCPLPSAEEIPAVNLDIAYGSEHLRVYQIQLSRGCPYHCSFCSVEHVAGRRVRACGLRTCVTQIAEAKRQFPNIKTIAITDDCPTFDKERFKHFLRMFAEANLACELWIDNVRANLIDEEMIQLYIAAGGRNICLGVETGHPEVFKLIHKGESLADIIHAAELVRKYGLTLGLCFVIGLPEDNLDRHRSSIMLAKKLGPDYIFWNMCIPWPGTEVYHWYQKHGQIGDLRNFSTLVDPRGNFRDPVSTTVDFPKKDRIKAWLMSNMETHDYFRNPRDLLKLFSLSCRHSLYRSFAFYFVKCFLPRLVKQSPRILRRISGIGLTLVHQAMGRRSLLMEGKK
jgi:radical SAM superfamily enzyme YgiQ (UPF0313 family)